MSSSVIDWNGALEQCGGDDEFLTELLEDFNSELETQMRKIQAELSKNVRSHAGFSTLNFSR